MFPYFNRHNKKRLIQSRVNVLAITESRAFHPGTASSQVGMAGIYLSRELGCTKSNIKTSRIGPDVQIHCLDWALATSTEFLRSYQLSC